MSRFAYREESVPANLRLHGVEDAARLSLGDFDEPDSSPAPGTGLSANAVHAAWFAAAVLVLTVAWFTVG